MSCLWTRCLPTLGARKSPGRIFLLGLIGSLEAPGPVPKVSSERNLGHPQGAGGVSGLPDLLVKVAR